MNNKIFIAKITWLSKEQGGRKGVIPIGSKTYAPQIAIDSIERINFDGEVRECLMDKELEILSNRKILVNIDLGENMTYILLNIANENISEKDIVKIIN